MDKALIRHRFAKASGSYPRQAFVQRDIALASPGTRNRVRNRIVHPCLFAPLVSGAAGAERPLS